MDLIICPKCSLQKIAHATDKHLCVDCVKAENNRYSHFRNHQEDWLAVAKANGLDPWLQQPGETQWEYSIWLSYRDSYPGKKPSFSEVALAMDTTYNVVHKVARRWTFHARMQAWMKHCDDITMLQRRDEILSMNAAHINMAQRLREKLSSAIEHIRPDDLRPGEIATLAKLATDVERKAQIDTLAQVELRNNLLVDNENPEMKKVATKSSDLSEVVSILAKAGALGDVAKLGIRQTTEVVVVNNDDD